MLGGAASNPNAQQASYTGAEAEPCGFGKGDSRGTAELDMFMGVSEPLPKLMSVLDGESPSCCPATAPADALCPELGWSWP